MRYYSTRDTNTNDNGSDFEKVLFSGYTSDGGLYVPRDLPVLDWRRWREFSYKRIVAEILKAFVNDDRVPVEDIVNSVYSSNNFDHPDIVPVSKVFDDGVYIMELFHGATWSFKDYALQIIGPLLEFYLKLSKRRLILIVVTTGDTGSAAIEAVKNCSTIDIIVLFPKDRITPIQERQMTTIISDNVHIYPGEGVCGDLDNVVRSIFTDSEFVVKYNLGSINSINWARIMVQMAHWFYAYFRVMSPINRIGEKLTVAVPTGAAGNLCGALYAQKLGLPIVIAACNNPNDTIYEWLKTGSLRHRPVRDSLASAMDIDMPMNIERIIHLVSYKDQSCAEIAGEMANEMMSKFYDHIDAETPQELLAQLKSHFTSCKVNDGDIGTTIKRLHEETGYICCPHTATAVHYAYSNPEKRPIVCASTASPSKFGHIYERLGINLDRHPQLQQLQNSPTRYSSILKKGENWVEIIKSKIMDIGNRNQ